MKNALYFLFQYGPSIFFPPILSNASRGRPTSTGRSWTLLIAALRGRRETGASWHTPGEPILRGLNHLLLPSPSTWLPAPTWVSNGHRSLGVSANLGPILGMEEVDGKLLDLAVVQEGVYLS